VLISRRDVSTLHDEKDGMHDVVAHGQSTRVVEDVGMKSTPLHRVHDAAKRGLGARATSKIRG
jgi:hypothetical protein